MEIDDLGRIVRQGRMPAGIYSSPEIHDLERDRLFSRSWLFLAHTSEIPVAGDFVVRRMLDDSFIVVRGDDGEVRVLLNMCLHRGMQVCRAEVGNADHFRCPYHAWTYRNDGRLATLPFHEAAYGGESGYPKSTACLRPPAQVSTHRGLIFACLDPDAPPLEEAIGDFAFYLDLYVSQSEEGIELRGPQRWIIRSNWKIAAENFSGDSYHTPHTHVSAVEIGLFLEPTGRKRASGALYWAGGGGGTTYKLPTEDFDSNLAYIGYPPEMASRAGRHWNAQQREMVGRAGFMVSAATLFPNLSLVHNWPRVKEGDDVVPFISLRLWQPISATETEVYSWFAVDCNAPDWYKEQSYRAYLLCFGSSGMFEQDDVENWTSITSVSKGRMASTTLLDNSMGLGPEGGYLHPPLADWPGPGRAIQGYGEYNQREFLIRWADHLATP